MTQALRLTLSEQQPTSDQTVIRRIAAGDEDALRELFGMHGQVMSAFALRLTGDPVLADEVVQESLVAAWQGARRFRGDSRVRTWLLGIVHHKAINLLRKRTDVSIEEGVLDLAAAAETPGRQVEDSDRQRIMRSAIDRLPVEQRAVLDLFFYQGYRMDEIAAILDCPTGTVKSRLFNARTALKGILIRTGIELEDL